MGHAIPRQQPAVVLRSNFKRLRALLAIALVAVAGLTVAVVILANDSDRVGSTSAARASEDGTSSSARPGSETEFHGSKASEDGTSTSARPGSEIALPGRVSALP
jgi:hypothetical protein